MGKPKVRAVLIKSINLSVPGNSLVFLLDRLLSECCINKEKKKNFGMQRLFRGKMGMKDPEGRFGLEFLPDMVRLLAPCGTLVQYQLLWWRSPLLASVTRTMEETVREAGEHRCQGR